MLAEVPRSSYYSQLLSYRPPDVGLIRLRDRISEVFSQNRIAAGSCSEVTHD